MVNDYLIDTRTYVAALLHSGVRVMIYVGTYDWICKCPMLSTPIPLLNKSLIIAHRQFCRQRSKSLLGAFCEPSVVMKS